MKVAVAVSHGDRGNERGIPVPTTEATCQRCENAVWAWGDHGGSLKRCLAELRDTCPRGESNYYEVDP